MNPMLIGALIGAGYGILKNQDDTKSTKAERKLNAEIMRNSPWTGMKPANPYTKEPSLLGNVSAGALTGASFGASDVFKGQPQAAAAQGAPQMEQVPYDYGTGGSMMSPAEFQPDVKSFQQPVNLTEDTNLYDKFQEQQLANMSPWERMQYIQMMQGGGSNYA